MAAGRGLRTTFEADTSPFEAGCKRGAQAADQFEKHIKTGLGGALHELKSSFGRGSALFEGLHALSLAGPLIGVGLAVREATHLADIIKEANVDLALHKKTWGGVADEIAGAIPFLGEFWKLGRSIRGAFTGEGVKDAMDSVAADRAERELDIQHRINKGLSPERYEEGFDKQRHAVLHQFGIDEQQLRSGMIDLTHPEYGPARPMPDSELPKYREEVMHNQALHDKIKELEKVRDLDIQDLNYHEELTKVLEEEKEASKLATQAMEKGTKETERRFEIRENDRDIAVKERHDADAAQRDWQDVLEGRRTSLISRAASIAQVLAQQPPLPGFAQQGSSAAISVANRFAVSEDRDPVKYAKQAVVIAQKQLDALDDLNTAIGVLVGDDGQPIGGG